MESLPLEYTLAVEDLLASLGPSPLEIRAAAERLSLLHQALDRVASRPHDSVRLQLSQAHDAQVLHATLYALWHHLQSFANVVISMEGLHDVKHDLVFVEEQMHTLQRLVGEWVQDPERLMPMGPPEDPEGTLATILIHHLSILSGVLHRAVQRIPTEDV